MTSNQAREIAKASIQAEYNLADSPQIVWRALTDSELLAAWLMPNDFRAEVGHRFTFRSQPTPGWDGVVYCEVHEIVPERLLVYSWRGGSHDLTGYGEQLDTIVTWTLVSTLAGGTKLLLEHAGFDAESFAFKAMGQGWRGKIASRMSEVMARLA
jgi:uncharacterized protein YndB with AHSA1/START domain